MKYRYEIIIYWSAEDKAFIAGAPELPGCAADGATYGEAVANVEIIIDEWIETAKELGREIPESVSEKSACAATRQPEGSQTCSVWNRASIMFPR